MTLTRQYFNGLIDLLHKLCCVDVSHVGDYFEIKLDLHNLINRIIKYNLIKLNLSDSFLEILSLKVSRNIWEEKMSLIIELSNELDKCLTGRLRYGGEFMYYWIRINISLLSLTLDELSYYQDYLNKSEDFRLSNFNYSTIEAKEEKIRSLRETLPHSKFKKKEKRITENDYQLVEKKLNEYLTEYKSYININYTSFANHFPFYNKKIRVYITQGSTNENYEFRVHSYECNDGNSNLQLVHQYYDFYPSYSYNLEEISSPLLSWGIRGMRKSDLDFDNFFSIKDVHRQLIDIFIQNSLEVNVVKFVEFVFKCKGYKFSKPDIVAYKFDLFGKVNEECYLMEIFHLESRSADVVSGKLKQLKKISKLCKVMFIFTSYPGELIVKMLKKNNVLYVSMFDIIWSYFDNDNSEIYHWFIKSIMPSLSEKKENKLESEGDMLISRLDKCEYGEREWSEYEKIGIDIFRFLFADNFKSYFTQEQASNSMKNHRRDLVVSNYFKDPSSFWASVKSDYKSNSIVIDFKNYSEKLDSATLFGVSKYLTNRVGGFAIVFSRKGVNKTAQIEQRSMLENGKLIVVFSDEELKEMIREKIVGENPADRLKSKEFELIKML